MESEEREGTAANGNGRPNLAYSAAKVVDDAAFNIQTQFVTFLEQFRGSASLAAINGTNATTVSNTVGSQFAATELTSELPDSLPVSSLPSLPSLYVLQLQEMKAEGKTTLYVDYNHLFAFSNILASAISDQYLRVEPFLRRAIQVLVKRHLPEYLFIANSQTIREFSLSFYSLSPIYKMRELSCARIGQLISMSATVTRSSEVRPELSLGTFQCLNCSATVKDIEQQFKYTEPSICINPNCQNRTNWKLIVEKSSFVDWQRLHVQENSGEIPPGSMPRSIDVIVRGDLVERAKAGDKVNFTGCLIVVPDISQLSSLTSGGRLENSADEGRPKEGFATGGGISGLRSLGVRELNYKLAFVACMVHPSHSKFTAASIHGLSELEGEESIEDLFTPQEMLDIQKIRDTPQLYNRLIESIAPTIFGHNDIKSGILLMLFGGVHKNTPEGINLRGDINLCIVGDPGTAKSQFLKYVVGFLPRCVYTSGKASSAAGLTASVIKDEETGEFTIEAGALMLADNGICAIDEFDKMDLKDQIAIHEAMEQQTISIAKAGIQATLNARTSILAAANPIGGRYDKKKTLRQNIAMTAPIMSRFDLFFVILDECNENSDYNIARHILSIHRHKDSAVDPEFSMERLQRYIKWARTIKPRLPMESANLLVERYAHMRQNDLSSGSSYRMTVRQLESMIRLSEALARLHGDDTVRVKYVQEAVRLLKSSIIRVENDIIDIEEIISADPSLMDISSKETEGKSNDPLLPLSSQPTVAMHATASNKISMNYETYQRISNMLIFELNRRFASEDDTGITREALIDWYLDTIEHEITTEDELLARTKEVRGVIDRLVRKDCILIELKDGNDVRLVVHPNYNKD